MYGPLRSKIAIVATIIILGLSSLSYGAPLSELPLLQSEDLLLAKAVPARCEPLPCSVLADEDLLRVGAFIRRGSTESISVDDVVCSPTQRTRLDLNKESAVEYPVNARRLGERVGFDLKIGEMLLSLSVPGSKMTIVASSIVSESMIDVKQIKKAIAAIPSSCRTMAKSKGAIEVVRLRKFGRLAITLRISEKATSEALDELEDALGDSFDLQRSNSAVTLTSRQMMLFAVQTGPIDRYLANRTLN